MACDDCERLRQERDTFYMDYRLKCDVETKAAHLRAEKAERERDEAREACVNSANAWLAAANHAEKAEQERDEALERLKKVLGPECHVYMVEAPGEPLNMKFELACVKFKKELEKAEQENARLREALAEFDRIKELARVVVGYDVSDSDDDYIEAVDALRSAIDAIDAYDKHIRARTALGGE